MKTYLLAGAMLIAANFPAEAADPRVIIPAAPKVIYAAPIEVMPATVVVEVAVPMKIVDQGPRYDGPNLVAFPKLIFHEDQPVRAYPYVRTYEAAHAYVPEAVVPRPPRVARYRAPIRALN
jgi:hypothetical protein